MITFHVPDMTCGHCTAAIARALQAVDPRAEVDIELRSHQVRIRAHAATPEALAAAIEDAGYAVRPVATPEAAAAVPARAGCGCGCGPTKAGPAISAAAGG